MATRFLQSGTHVTTKDGRKGVVVEYKSNNCVVVTIPSKNTMWPFPTLIECARKELKLVEFEYEEAPF